MQTILHPCAVPWSISPTMSGVTLTHSESDTEPACQVTFGAGRLTNEGRTDMRLVQIRFAECYFARTGYHSDDGSITDLHGYELSDAASPPEGEDYLDWRHRKWRSDTVCPDSGFYVAEQSAWLRSLPESFQRDSAHYVIDGRDGYVEVVARAFEWTEWMWATGHRDDVPSMETAVAHGTGTAQQAVGLKRVPR